MELILWDSLVEDQGPDQGERVLRRRREGGRECRGEGEGIRVRREELRWTSRRRPACEVVCVSSRSMGHGHGHGHAWAWAGQGRAGHCIFWRVAEPGRPSVPNQQRPMPAVRPGWGARRVGSAPQHAALNENSYIVPCTYPYIAHIVVGALRLAPTLTATLAAVDGGAHHGILLLLARHGLGTRRQRGIEA